MDHEVDVLLASYNGAKYIRAQLDSILQQETQIPFRVLVSDDGSQDGTVEIVREYARRFSNLVLLDVTTERMGIVRNFERLLSVSSAAYIMLSDQDDWWYGDKLTTCVSLLKAREASTGGGPCMIYSDMLVVDSELGTLYPSISALNACPSHVSLNGLLAECVGLGCTTAFNRAVCNLALPFPEAVYGHDWWLLLVAKCYGDLQYIGRPLGKYRLHASNAVGVPRRNLMGKIYNFLFKSGTKGIYDITIRQARALQTRLAERAPADPAPTALVDKYVATSMVPLLARKFSLVRHRFLPFRRLKMLSTVFGLW